MIWSVLSLIVLIGGTGVMFAIYGRWSQKIGWHSEEAPALSFRQPEDVGLTKSQRVVAWYVFTIAALFLVQPLLGALAEHYRADVLSFFGFDLGRLLPFSLARTWHVQLSLFWTAIGLLGFLGLGAQPPHLGRGDGDRLQAQSLHQECGQGAAQSGVRGAAVREMLAFQAGPQAALGLADVKHIASTDRRVQSQLGSRRVRILRDNRV